MFGGPVRRHIVPVIWLTHHRYTILDEADELISTDWEGEMSKIMSGGGAEGYTGDFEFD